MKQSLSPEQSYVIEIADEFGIDFTIVYHDKATNTCFEKAAILGGWSTERVIKTVYFRSDQHVVGVVSPEFGVTEPFRIPTKDLFSQTFALSRKQAARYTCNDYVPPGMAYGTCTPFPLVSSMGAEISSMIVCDYPAIDDSYTDISIGGVSEEARKVSMHIKYKDIYYILNRKFGSLVRKVSFAPIRSEAQIQVPAEAA